MKDFLIKKYGKLRGFTSTPEFIHIFFSRKDYKFWGVGSDVEVYIPQPHWWPPNFIII